MFSGEGVGDLEITPAAAAIARYLGIDLSPEGKAARYKKGLNVIVTGPPLSGKSFQAKVGYILLGIQDQESKQRLISSHESLFYYLHHIEILLMNAQYNFINFSSGNRHCVQCCNH